MSVSDDSDFSVDGNSIDYNDTFNENDSDDPNENSKDDYILDDDQPESDFMDSDFNYKLSDDESDGDLKIDQQLKELEDLNKRDIYVAPEQLLRKIGILDPMGLEDNPLTGKPYENLYYNPELEWDSSYKYQNGITVKNKTYADFATDPRPDKKGWSELPMYSKAEEAIQTIYDNQVILLTSGTGSGKTVLTPKLALHALNYKGRIAITLPKLPPVTGASSFASMCLDVNLGEHVSKKHSNVEKQFVSETSNLVYQTDGSIINPLQGNDPLLYNYDCVIMDEAHERSINIDTILLLLKDVCIQRPEFKLIIMSATVNTQLFIDYFPKEQFKFALFEAGGDPPKKITEYFLDDPIMKKMNLNGPSIIEKDKQVIRNPKNRDYYEDANKIVIEIFKQFPKMPNDILVFVGGGKVGKNAQLDLKEKIKKELPNLVDTYYSGVLEGGTKTNDEEKERLVNGGYKNIPGTNYTRSVIYATEVAESSITFSNLEFVIDTGINHKPKFYYEQDCNIQVPIGIPKASHMQRKGRTGRTCEGVVFNLFSKEFYEKSIPDYAEFPIHLDDMSWFIMDIMSDTQKITHIELPFSYDYISPKSLNCYLSKFIEPPKKKSVECMILKMYALNIFDVRGHRGYLNNLGLAMSKFKGMKNLCLRKMIILGYLYKCLPEILRFVSFASCNECKFENLFIDPKKEKEKLKKLDKESEIIELEKKFKRVVLKYSSQYGDVMGVINLLNEYTYKKEGLIDINTNRIISEPLDEDEFAYWCKTNFINTKSLKGLKKSGSVECKSISDLERQLRNIKNDFKELYPHKSFIELMEPYKLLDTQNKEMNLLLAIADSCLSNIITPGNKNEYQTILFREKEVKKYLYFYKHLKSKNGGKLREHYFSDDKDFYQFMYQHYRFFPKDLKIIKKKEVPPKNIRIGTGYLRNMINRYGSFSSFYNPPKQPRRYLSYLFFEQHLGLLRPEYVGVSVLTPNVINILKSSTLEQLRPNDGIGLKRRILEKANIPVNLSTPMVFSRKNKKEQLKRTKKRGGSLRTISRKKINLKKGKLTSLKHKK